MSCRQRQAPAQGLVLDRREGERGQEEVVPEQEAQASLAIDRRTVRLKVGDIPLNCPDRDLEAFRQRGRSPKVTASQRLQDCKEAVGAAHLP